MRTHFHRDVHFRLTVKPLKKGFRRGHHPFLQYDLSPFVQNADAALFVAQIDSYISAGLPGRLFDILAHKLVSLIAPLGSAFYLQAAAYCMPPQETSLLIPLLGGLWLVREVSALQHKIGFGGRARSHSKGGCSQDWLPHVQSHLKSPKTDK